LKHSELHVPQDGFVEVRLGAKMLEVDEKFE
jgi:hypothetical protein